MNKKEYRDYLKSDHWQNKRLDKFNGKKRGCQICGDKNIQLHVHHLNYQHMGDEDCKKDLIIICYRCHNLIHQLIRIGKIKFPYYYRKARRRRTLKALTRFFKVKTIPELNKIWEKNNYLDIIYYFKKLGN